MGCFFKHGKKDVYYDGHKREDVVEYCGWFVVDYLRYLEDSDSIVGVKDKVIYRSNEFNPQYWHVPENLKTGEMTNVVLQRKGLGWGIMFSGFITKDGFVQISSEDLAAINAKRAQSELPPLQMYFQDDSGDCFSYYMYVQWHPS